MSPYLTQRLHLVYRNRAGLVADFHALRHTLITNLATGGVHPKVAQALGRLPDLPTIEPAQPATGAATAG